jgi:hypothetical protein
MATAQPNPTSSGQKYRIEVSPKSCGSGWMIAESLDEASGSSDPRDSGAPQPRAHSDRTSKQRGSHAWDAGHPIRCGTRRTSSRSCAHVSRWKFRRESSVASTGRRLEPPPLPSRTASADHSFARRPARAFGASSGKSADIATADKLMQCAIRRQTGESARAHRPVFPSSKVVTTGRSTHSRHNPRFPMRARSQQ